MPVPRSIALTATLVAVAAASGCVQQTPGPLPQATPSYSCTPVAGGTPYACYENQYQQAEAQNKLYAEAEAVFRRFNVENERVYRLGGVGKPTAILEETLTGEALESVMANYADLLKSRTRMIGGEFEVASVQRVHETQSGSLAAVRVCLDISAVQLKSAGHSAYRVNQDGVETFYFVQDGTALKAGQITNKWVKSC